MLYWTWLKNGINSFGRKILHWSTSCVSPHKTQSSYHPPSLAPHPEPPRHSAPWTALIEQTTSFPSCHRSLRQQPGRGIGSSWVGNGAQRVAIKFMGRQGRRTKHFAKLAIYANLQNYSGHFAKRWSTLPPLRSTSKRHSNTAISPKNEHM